MLTNNIFPKAKKDMGPEFNSNEYRDSNKQLEGEGNDVRMDNEIAEVSKENILHAGIVDCKNGYFLFYCLETLKNLFIFSIP